MGTKSFMEWYQPRREAPLYVLQAEMCDWAVEEIARQGDELDASSTLRETWSSAIRKRADSLRKDRTAVPYSGFGREELMLYQP